MEAQPRFPSARQRSGMYESFYLRAVSPLEPVGLWIRNTVHKRPGHAPTGSVWCTIFDGRDTAGAAPHMQKLTSPRVEVPAGGWISVGGQSSLGPDRAEGVCGDVSWALRFQTPEPALEHLQPSWRYRSPLPRTKLTSPAPAARFNGTVQLSGESIELDGWPGMVGHNWGSEHAERWIWLHGIAFNEQPEAWLDLALGRILLGGRMTPWVANGMLTLDGRRHRLGGLSGGRPQVSEHAGGCKIELPGKDGLRLGIRADVPAGAAAGGAMRTRTEASTMS
jgi:hypothetical protein